MIIPSGIIVTEFFIRSLKRVVNPRKLGVIFEIEGDTLHPESSDSIATREDNKWYNANYSDVQFQFPNLTTGTHYLLTEEQLQQAANASYILDIIKRKIGEATIQTYISEYEEELK